jgi:subtilisin family serine protease
MKLNFKILLCLFVFTFFKVNLFSDEYSSDIYIRVKENVNLSNLNLKLSKYNIKLEKSILLYELSMTSKETRFLSMNSYEENIIEKEEPLLRTFRVSLENPKVAKKVLEEIILFNEIEIAEQIIYPKLLGSSSFNDPLINEQDVLNEIEAFDAYKISAGDSNIVIGISDSGADQNHEDISPNLFRFWGEIPNNGIDDDGNGYVDDFMGLNLQSQNSGGTDGGNTSSAVTHGLEVAGITGAMANNEKGIIGVGNKCRIFPIKITPGNSASLPFAYESIIYAALNKFDVLNCSWGAEKRPSPIEQSIIDYAIANNVVIVASAGNKEGSDNSTDVRVRDWYPASYNGVIAVGSLSTINSPFNNFVMHPNVDIMVRGEGNYTTKPNNAYGRFQITGTSFASPVIAGAMGILKSRFPDLNPYQLEQIVRKSGRNLSEFNPDWQKVIPRAFNFLDAMNIDVDKIFALTRIGYSFRLGLNDTIKHYRKGDEIDLKIRVKNYFKSANNIKFKLSIAKDFFPNYVEILSDEVEIEKIDENEELEISGFSLKINEVNFSRIILRVDYSSDSKSDFFLIPFDNYPSMTHFENNEVLLSLCEDGKIGFNNTSKQEGYGFLYKNLKNTIEYSGFIGIINNQTFSAVSGSGFNFSDIFETTHFLDNKNEAEYEINQTDVMFSNKVSMNSNPNYPWIRFDMRFWSSSNKNQFAIGIIGDYDVEIGVNGYLNNRTKHFEEANFSNENLKCATQIAYNEDIEIYIGISAFSEEEDAIPQAAGLSQQQSFFPTSQVINSALTSGISLQISATTDIGFSSGVNFSSGLNSSGKSCSFCYGMGRSEEELRRNLEMCVLGEQKSIISKSNIAELRYESEAVHFNNINKANYDLIISNIQGKIIYQNANIFIENNTSLNFNLKSGIYFLSLHNNNEKYNFKLIVIN